MSSQFLIIPSSVGWLSYKSERYFDASLPIMIYWDWTKNYFKLNIISEVFLDSKHWSTNEGGKSCFRKVVSCESHFHIPCSGVTYDCLSVHSQIDLLFWYVRLLFYL